MRNGKHWGACCAAGSRNRDKGRQIPNRVVGSMCGHAVSVFSPVLHGFPLVVVRGPLSSAQTACISLLALFAPWSLIEAWTGASCISRKVLGLARPSHIVISEAIPVGSESSCAITRRDTGKSDKDGKGKHQSNAGGTCVSVRIGVAGSAAPFLCSHRVV